MDVLDCDALWIRGGRVIDPFTGRDEITDVAIVDGCYSNDVGSAPRILDATGCVVCPGFADIHVHLREPGQTDKETIATGTAAAASGGFTYVACMPNTKPPLDSPDAIRFVLEHAGASAFCGVGPIGTITRGRAGKEVAELRAMKAAGAVAFSDDGDGVEDDRVMHSALQCARELGAVLIQHCEYHALSAGGVMHDGDVARRLGLPGLDPRSEEAMIERDIDLSRKTGGRYHVAHISTCKGIELVRRAKADGVPVTAEVCTHHLVLDDRACAEADPNTKMHPPLRPVSDVEACRQGLLDGTIDCIVTDHAPHTMDEKQKGFMDAPPGIVGLETAIGLAARAMVSSGLADWPALVAWFTESPADILGLRPWSMKVGETANLTLIDLKKEHVVDSANFESKGRNTPFHGWKLPVKPILTVRGRTILGPEALSLFRT